MNKSVLVTALSAALISTGVAAPDRDSKTFQRGKRVVESGASKGKATIVGQNINVRSAPDSNSSLVTKVTGGNATILAQKGDWYKLKFQYGSQGWVRKDFLKVAGQSAAKMIPIKLDSALLAVNVSAKSSNAKSTSSSAPEGLTRYASLVNKSVKIYRGPSSSNSVSGKVKGGKALVIDKAGDFYQVKFQYGSKGWVKADYLVFPSNFDFKNSKNRAVIQSKPETVVATKTTPKVDPKVEFNSERVPENTVEVVGTGERITVPAEEVPEVKTPASSNSNPIIATVIGDNVAVRKGASTTNSILTKVDGGRATIVDKRGEFYQLRFSGGTVGWVHGNYVSYPGHIVTEAPKQPIMSSDPDKASRLIANARTFTGVRYSYGSSSRAATDCSGFTLQVFKSVGINLPRTARAQSGLGTKVSRAQLQKGDLIFFNTLGFISHVGIYIGNSRFIHASSGRRQVTESSLNESYYGKVFLFGKRLLPPSQVKKLDLPNPGELPNIGNNDRDDSGDENKVDISKDSGKSEPGNGRD